jgi:predicted nucleic acid-binding protein
MPDRKEIVINTGPLIALVAATGDLVILRSLYSRIVVPSEVCGEISAGGNSGFAVVEFYSASFLEKLANPTNIGTFLHNSLDTGEASVIQTALDLGITTVCIDEAVGRRIARMNALAVTGSIGILLRAKQEGASLSIRTALNNMHRHGIWLSKDVTDAAIKLAGE